MIEDDGSEQRYRYLDIGREEIVALLPDVSTILDVGCGLGGFGAAVKRARPSVRVIGVESDARAADVAATRYDEVIRGEFPVADLGWEVDCVVFNDVLEHMVDPWAAVSAAHALLPSGGWVVASIPNVRYWPVLHGVVVGGRWEYEDSGVLDRTHLRFFTRSSMEGLLRSGGLRVRDVVPVNLLGLDEMSARHRRFFRLLHLASPQREVDLRAQQYALLAQKD
jgi:2-polyprenyl-3-methyl-5-hydroxy-6-metoxy-1,4-benzoquinol methylase